MQAGFRKWLDGLSLLEKIAIPHQYFHAPLSDCVDNIESHTFGDVSLKGYGDCVYLRYQADSGLAKCTLVGSCAKVAQFERKTLPRLELLTCIW